MHIRRGLGAALAVVLAVAPLAFVTTAGAGAAPADLDDGSVRRPPNDDFAAAITLEAGRTFTGTARDATTEADDPATECGAYDDAPTVWYRYTAPADGVFSVE